MCSGTWKGYSSKQRKRQLKLNRKLKDLTMHDAMTSATHAQHESHQMTHQMKQDAVKLPTQLKLQQNRNYHSPIIV